jgi:hypothetical protein
MREAPHFLSPLRAPVEILNLKIFEQEVTEGCQLEDFQAAYWPHLSFLCMRKAESNARSSSFPLPSACSCRNS